jgi:hypothetical protein
MYFLLFVFLPCWLVDFGFSNDARQIKTLLWPYCNYQISEVKGSGGKPPLPKQTKEREINRSLLRPLSFSG